MNVLMTGKAPWIGDLGRIVIKTSKKWIKSIANEKKKIP